MNVQQACAIVVRDLISRHPEDAIRFVNAQFETDHGVHPSPDDTACIRAAVFDVLWDIAATVNDAAIREARKTLIGRAWDAVADEPMEVDAL